MSHIFTYFKDLNFRKKLRLICLFISLIPILLLGSFSCIQIHNLLIEREQTAIHETLKQETKNLDSKLQSYQNAINFIVWNDKLKAYLTESQHTNFDMFKFYRDVLDTLFLTIRTTHNEISRITIYTDNPIYPHGQTLRPLSDIESLSWYKNTQIPHTPFFVVSPETQTLGLVCKMYMSNTPYSNILYMELDYKKVFTSLYSLYESDYGIFITTKNTEPIYTYQHFSNKDKQYILSPSELLNPLSDTSLPKNYVLDQIHFSSVPWIIYLYRPVANLSLATSQILLTVLLLIILCIGITLIISTLLSYQVVKPLEDLSHNMSAVQKGDMRLTVTQTSHDEIGHLIGAFSHMLTQLNYLIDEVYKSKIAQQRYEMRALQAQINPHFLYNTLALINNKAIMADQDDISEVTLLLATFYRTSLNKGQTTISVKDELKNTYSYISIQSILHSHSFDVVYEIDESIYNYQMINLLLQPLVENAIIHGLDHKTTPTKPLLSVSAFSEEKTLTFIIEDNGCGMEKSKLDSLLICDSSGYGVKNVHHRIQLAYGKEYGLFYKSSLDEGTCVTLKLPKNKI